MLYSRKQLWSLMIPLMVEQLLNATMGMVDTIMITSVGSYAISAVSLVDSINTLISYVFTAMATGGTIICAQYLGRNDIKRANKVAYQLLLSMFLISFFISILFFIFRVQLLKAIFGQIDSKLMSASNIYFFFSILSYPFIALYNGGAAILRAENDSKTPMKIALISNCIHICINGVLIYLFNYGVKCVAISTLLSRFLMGAIVLMLLRNKNHLVHITNLKEFKIEPSYIKTIMNVGIPTGVENGMFQFGKLLVQSTVSQLPTYAIAANAMVSTIENFESQAALGMGLGLMTVVGQCLGKNRQDEAKSNIEYITKMGFLIIVLSCMLACILIKPITVITGMEVMASELTIKLVLVVSIVKPIPWTISFIPSYGMKAAGDTKYSLIVSTLIMWIVRVLMTIYLIKVVGMGVYAVWISMMCDWIIKAVFVSGRYHSGKWLNHKMI